MPTRSRFTFWRIILLSTWCAIAGFATIILSRRPSATRTWAPDHQRAPEIVFSDSLVRIGNFRSFRYRSETDFDPIYQSRTVHLDRLTSVALVLTPFSTAWRGPAHSFVTFAFSDSTFVAISIEARREVDESYGLLKGLGRNYELIYVIGDESDLIGRRAAFGEFDVYLYPIRTTPERARAVFVDMLRRADRLRTTPEFYNTAGNNCTSNLVRHVNRVVPSRIPAGLKLLLPGYADEVATELGLIDATLSVDEARVRFKINAAARDHLHDPDFSFQIRGNQ
jgi:hypothetical protein